MRPNCCSQFVLVLFFGNNSETDSNCKMSIANLTHVNSPLLSVNQSEFIHQPNLLHTTTTPFVWLFKPYFEIITCSACQEPRQASPNPRRARPQLWHKLAEQTSFSL
eukprot:TRINITY_DN731_c0_g1_i3.p1 TRINITY_DN731_c0_g1~~TRINITY_DN731_c0_g1_i3.p1  ORF type:complete len:107 (+),score=6.76 TRINITY_DN731_c0_g1_i3:286-606(+)